MERFTKEDAARMEDALGEIMKAFPKKKLGEFLGHFNELFLFLSAAKKNAPANGGSNK